MTDAVLVTATERPLHIPAVAGDPPPDAVEQARRHLRIRFPTLAEGERFDELLEVSLAGIPHANVRFPHLELPRGKAVRVARDHWDHLASTRWVKARLEAGMIRVEDAPPLEESGEADDADEAAQVEERHHGGIARAEVR